MHPATLETAAKALWLRDLPLREAIAWAEATDAEAFADPFAQTRTSLPPGELRWWSAADDAFALYRAAAHRAYLRNTLALDRVLGSSVRGPALTDLDEAIDAARASPLPRWPSGIPQLDAACGGLYGVTVVGGEPGAGKSLFVLRSAFLAAAHGWRVVYVDSELGVQNLRMRLDALRTGDPEAYRTVMHDPLGRLVNFCAVDTLHGGLASLAEYIDERTDPRHERILVVLDHVHDVARGLLRAEPHVGEGAWFRMIERIADAAKVVRRETEGSVSWLLVAELNKDGRIRGGQLDYAADCVVSLAKSKDSPNVTQVRVPKGREGGEGGYGDFLRHHELGRLASLEHRDDESPGGGIEW